MRLVIIPCGGAKLGAPAPARELYVGGYFRACLRLAESTGARVVVLSALHGLVELDDELAPYDLRMGDPGSIDERPEELRGQAADLGLDELDDVVVLGGARYVDAALRVWPHADAPLRRLPAGRRGIGCQLAALNRWTETGIPA